MNTIGSNTLAFNYANEYDVPSKWLWLILLLMFFKENSVFIYKYCKCMFFGIFNNSENSTMKNKDHKCNKMCFLLESENLHCLERETSFN